MANLKSGDFNKTASKGPYAGKTRKQIIFSKITDRKNFIIGSTKNGQKILGVNYEAKNSNGWNGILTYILPNENIKDKKLYKKISIKEVFKDPDFGGGGGSGGGSDDTEIVECMQCFYCSLVFNILKGKISETDMMMQSKQLESMDNAKRYCVTSKSYDSCIKDVPVDWIDDMVFIKIANKLYDNYKNHFESGKYIYFHRGSKFMKALYAAKKTVHTLDKKFAEERNIKAQAPGSFSDDKWNPCDIWATTLDQNSKPLKESATSWGALNTKVAEEAALLKTIQKIRLLGISLKRIGKGAVATIKTYNAPNEIKPSYKFKEWKWGKTNDFFSSQDMYLHSDGGEVQFRTFQGPVSWQGEIKGKSAAGGKIGGGNVDFYVEEVYKKSVFSNSKSFKTADDENKIFSKLYKKIQEKDENVLKNYYDQYKKYNKKGQALDINSFHAALMEKGINFINSKFLCLQLVDILESGTAKQKDELTTLIFLYASSNTKQSSHFIKVS